MPYPTDSSRGDHFEVCECTTCSDKRLRYPIAVAGQLAPSRQNFGKHIRS